MFEVLVPLITIITTLAIGIATLWYVVVNYLPTVRTALPNEWLIIIKNGEQRLAGVGLKAHVSPMETWVTFPSVLTKVSFEANQTTAEMQGVQVTGFAVFSVLRSDDGPFRYYKYVQGGGKEMAESNLKGMAESLLRKHVATTSLDSVLKDRASLKEAVHKEMTASTKGWGVWLETLEIQDIRICSKSLFEDLQAAFRQDTHLNAEKIRLDSEKTLSGHKSEHEQQMFFLNNKTAIARSKANEEEKTSREKTEGDSALQRQKIKSEQEQQRLAIQYAAQIAQQQADEDVNQQKVAIKYAALIKQQQAEMELAQKQLLIDEQKNETTRKKKIAQQQLDHDITFQAENLSRIRKLADEDFALESRKNSLAVDSAMTEVSMQKYRIDSTASIYKALPLHEIKVSNFVAQDSLSCGGLAALLPALSAVAQTSSQ